MKKKIILGIFFIIFFISFLFFINNYDTIFSKNVIITYLDNKITGDYLDFSLDKNLMIISKGVILENNTSSLKADVIEMNVETKNIKIFMYEEGKKVNIRSLN